MTDNIHIRISRVGEPQAGIYIHERGGTRFYDNSSWDEFCRMISDFNRTGVKSIQNYPELPTRTPLHANQVNPPPLRKSKPNLDDLA